MHVVRSTDGDTTDRTGSAIFDGTVHGHALSEGRSEQINAAIVHFSPGAKTRMHRHASDQLLYIVAGIGKVGANGEEHTVGAGDFVVIPAGEDHWHGAGDTGSPMSHLTITLPGGETIVEGQPQ
ncbi:MAG: cupin domain-containing protein [Chloroflexota bacterium]